MHVVLAMLIREFEWSLTPGQDQRFTLIPLPRQRSGTIVELHRRAPAHPA
jgi:hypothetical protein